MTSKSTISAANEKLSIYKLLPSFSLIDNETTSINKKTVHTMEFEYYNPVFRSIIQEMWSYITNGQDIAIFEFITNPQKYHQYEPVFQKMLVSFKFKS